MLPHDIFLALIVLVIPIINRNTRRNASVFPSSAVLLNVMEPACWEVEDLALLDRHSLRLCIFIHGILGYEFLIREQRVDRDPGDGGDGFVECCSELFLLGVVDVSACADVLGT